MRKQALRNPPAVAKSLMLSDLFPSVRDRAGLKIIEEVRRFDIASRFRATWMPARAFGNAKTQV
jgi:hypothetical protein